jgi:hypothetical protein
LVIGKDHYVVLSTRGPLGSRRQTVEVKVRKICAGG